MRDDRYVPGRRLAWTLGATGAVALVLTLAAVPIVSPSSPEGAFWVVPMATLYVAGAFTARRRPGLLAARRLLLLGTSAITWMAGSLWIAIGYRRLGGGDWLVAANTLQSIVYLALPAAILAALGVYPDGVTRRWERLLPRLAYALAFVVPLALLLVRPTLQVVQALSWLKDYSGPEPHPASPLFVSQLHWLDAPLSAYGEGGLALGSAAAAALFALRYRRSRRRQRLQITWPLAAMIIAAVQPLGDALVSAGVLPRLAADTPIVLALTALAVALAIGLLRPELFDIRGVLRRTLAYVALWAVIGGAYVGIAAAAGIAASGKGVQVAVAAAIAATLLFQPARRALATRAAHWVYGERPSRAELLRRFGVALEHTLDPAELPARLAATIREGLGAEWARIDVAGLPPVIDGRPPGVRQMPAGEVPLGYGGERLGTLECGPAAGGLDQDLLSTLGRQAALAMGNARLASELRARLDELAASRARMVEAEEIARRRLERDIHDGVQQQIVALSARIGLARSQLERDPALARDTLEELQEETAQALSDLRELVRGIHPSVLGDSGVVEAIEARAARLPLAVAIDCDPALHGTRFPPAVEGAVYFVVSEAFANALKHADAGQLTVRLWRQEDALLVEIADDGRGFEVTPPPGSGLAGLADRTEALGGRFAVSSHPGAGTTVWASFPVGDAVLA